MGTTYYTMANVSLSTKVPSVASSTLLPTLRPIPEEEQEQSSQTLYYIFYPLGVIVILLIASALVVMLLRKRRLDRLRLHLMPLYNFDATDDDQEEWEAELLDDISESRSFRRGYKSMEFPSSNSAGIS